MKTGVELIAEERWEQAYKHNYGSEHDRDHDTGQLAKYAAMLAVEHTDAKVFEQGDQMDDDWGLIRHIKKIEKGKAAQIHCLKVAGALIAAEIDRLQSNE